MKYYNYETRFISLADDLSLYLKNNDIVYERSGAYSYYHFEILTDELGAKKINRFLDTLSEYEVVV